MCVCVCVVCLGRGTRLGVGGVGIGLGTRLGVGGVGVTKHRDQGSEERGGEDLRHIKEARVLYRAVLPAGQRSAL